MADKPKNKTESKADKSKEMSDNNLAITKLKEKNRMLDSDWTRVGGPVNSSQDVKDEQYAKDKLINDNEQEIEDRTARKFKKGGSVSSASSRADGCASKGKTRGRFV